MSKLHLGGEYRRCLPACLLVLRIQPQAIQITWCALDGEAGALLSFLDNLDAMLKRSG